MGWYGLSAGAAPVLAPTLAGVLVDMWNWRMIFILSIIIMSFSFVHAFVGKRFIKNAVKGIIIAIARE